MSYELIGKLIAKYDIVQRKETFKTREFVIEKSDDINGKTITNYVKFQCVQDRTSLPDRFNIGDTVKVLFNIKGSKWNKDGKDNYKTTSTAVVRVQGMTGGNYWGNPSSNGIADSIAEYFGRNFNHVFEGGVQNHIAKTLVANPEVLEMFINFDF